MPRTSGGILEFDTVADTAQTESTQGVLMRLQAMRLATHLGDTDFLAFAHGLPQDLCDALATLLGHLGG